MAVKILMSLDGVDQVTAGFAEAQKAGEDMMRSITGLSDQDPLKGFSLSVGNATQAMTEHGRSVSGVSEAYHILNPILRELGVSFGNLREFAALSRISLEAAAGVVGTIFVVALANVEETAARTRASLTSLFGSQDLGGKAFDALSKSAADLNTTVDGLAPAFKSATQALQEFNQAGAGFRTLAGVGLPQGIAGNVKDTAAAIDNLVKVIRTSGVTEAEAEKSTNAFFASIENGGKLTADALKKLDPGVIQLLAQAFGKGGESAQAFINQVRLAPIPINDVVNALARFGPQAQDAFDTLAVKSFHDELIGLFSDLKGGFTALTGTTFSAFVIGELQKIRIAIQATVQGFVAFQEFLNKPAGTGLIELNARFKQIDDDAKAALQSVNNLDAAVQKSPFINAPVSGATFLPPGSVTVPEQEIPIPRPRPADLQEVKQDIVGAYKDAHDEAAAIWAKPPFGPQGILPSADELSGAFNAFISAIEEPAKAAGAQAGFDINTGINQGLTQSPPDFSSIVTAFQTTGQQLATAAQAIWENLKSILSQVIVVPVQASAQGAAPQFARGGLISGPGTGTSDSIMAMLSNREFVVNARSTEFYGPGFFAALNAMLVPRDLLPGFAMGGLVKAIASTPSQSARTPIVLNIDRHTFNMTATDDVAAALQTLSVSEQMSAAGRSPGWRRS